MGEGVSLQSLNQWPPYIPMDPLCSMFYAKMMTVVDMIEMKVSLHCVDFINYEGDYGTELQQIMTHLAIYHPMHFVCFDI